MREVMGKRDLEFTEPFPWVCPKCGTAYVTSELQPRCAVCGTKEGPS